VVNAQTEIAACQERMPASRRFPPPWSVEEGETYFIVRDSTGRQLAVVYFDDPRVAAKPLTKDEARRMADNIAQLPKLRR
jgi:hypothetical protein